MRLIASVIFLAFLLTPSPLYAASATLPSDTQIQAYILTRINNYRAKYGLKAVKIDSHTCDFAKIRAQEISVDFSHHGFTMRVDNKSLPYPSYHYVNENLAFNSNYRNVVNSWINSASHAANLRANNLYVCVERKGNYYAYEGWKP